MKKKHPFNSGEYRIVHGHPNLILGHIWWPVEKKNAYHCVRVDDYGEPLANAKPEYIWDNYGAFEGAFVPKVA